MKALEEAEAKRGQAPLAPQEPERKTNPPSERGSAGEPAAVPDPILTDLQNEVQAIVSGDAWPTDEQVHDLLVPRTEPAGSYLWTVEWLHTVIKDEWLPADIGDRLMGLRHYFLGKKDVILGQYEQGGYRIRVFFTQSKYRIAVKKTAAPSAVREAMREHNAREVLRTLCKKGDRFDEVQFKWVHDQTRHGLFGFSQYDPFQPALDEALRRDLEHGLRTWQDTVWWWTDGVTVVFGGWKIKDHIPSGMQGDMADWFDIQPVSKNGPAPAAPQGEKAPRAPEPKAEGANNPDK